MVDGQLLAAARGGDADAIAALVGPFCGELHAHGQVAFGTYMWDETMGVYVAAGLDLLALRGTGIAEVVSFLTADLSDFGLPRELRG